MKRLAIIIAALVITACGNIHTGNVGVRTQFGKVQQGVEGEGFYVAVLSHVDEYSAKEQDIELKNLTPKAKDNLSLKDLDVAIYYRVLPTKIRDLTVKYSGQSHCDKGVCYPAYHLVAKVATNVANEEVAKLDSLTVHLNREIMAQNIKLEVQKAMDKNDPDTFTITRVLIQKVLTDPTIEASIQAAVANQKNLENKQVQVKIADQDAAIRVAEARGIAQAQGIINATLTREYLQHESNEVMKKFAEKGGTNTVLLPYGSGAAPLINVGK